MTQGTVSSCSPKYFIKSLLCPAALILSACWAFPPRWQSWRDTLAHSGLVNFSVFYLFSCSFAYGLVFLQFCHLFSIQLDSFHDLLSLCSIGTAHQWHQRSQSKAQVQQDKWREKQVGWHAASQDISLIKTTSTPDCTTTLSTLIMFWRCHTPPTFPTALHALCCSFSCCADIELQPQ